MPSKFYLTILLCLFAFNASAADNNENYIGWQANFKRIALDISSTSVSNAKEYQNSPNTSLSSDSESVYKGVFDFILGYGQPEYQWNNRVYMTYGKTTLKPYDKPKSSSESSDEILLTSDYMRKMWRYYDSDVGPFGSLGYQTEFTANNDAPRNKVIRGKAGIKLFNNQYISELYAAAVGEIDMTYSENDQKSAWEIGITAQYPLRDGVKFEVESYFRDYLTYSRYVGTDFKYDFNLVTRMDVKINDTFSIAPFMSYRRAQAREASSAGSNFMVGVSLAYSDIFNL